jgi:serine/threonine protein kinase
MQQASGSQKIHNKTNGKTYTLIRKMGKGNVGMVFLGMDEKEKKLVAIKLMNPKYSEFVSKDAVEQEYTCTKAITDIKDLGCQNYICLVDYFLMEKSPDEYIAVLVTEYNPNMIDMDAYLSERGILSQDEFEEIKGQLKTIVKKLHRHGIAHNDLHSGNIMIDRNTLTVKLIDFGTCETNVKEDDEDEFEKDLDDLDELVDILKSYVIDDEKHLSKKSKRNKEEED